ncbi:MAG: hypothetical protein A3F10_07670 [Coxiella sp. RIFCSPHIGHO2_12_FULL_42_15]|nr:MAG: hypothetical protein A3F10_07670 [Coxiella sp. RIFCSPHIGHO2_12_FULL_42_15]
MKGLLLDTHVWIWLMEGLPNLPHKVQKMINVEVQNTKVCIAAISMWEISMLVIKERIILEKPMLTWINDALTPLGIELEQLTPEIAVESCYLPDSFHGDPADRLIVATARVNSLALITHDKKMIEYGKKNYVTVIEV